MRSNVSDLAREPQLSREQTAAIARAISLFISSGLEVLEALGGDPDAEEDDPLEHNGDDRGDPAWIERIDQLKAPLPDNTVWASYLNSEDVEDDDPAGGELTSDDPAFDARSRRLANACSDGGAGCIISDSDYGGEERGEADQAECGHTMRYGVDQSREIGPDNPEAA